MNEHLTPADLFETHEERLGLTWVAGLGGADKAFRPEDTAAVRNSFFATWAGYLNLIHPSRIQVLGQAEMAYLSRLDRGTYEETLQRLFSSAACCVIICDDEKVPDVFASMADDAVVPLFRTALPGFKIVSHLQHHLSNVLAERINLHGVFMEVLGIGVLLTGRSGVGKSELALELISRNHRLVADDAPEFRRIAPDELNGCCPSGLIGFLEVRGLGILNIRAMFGDSVIKLNKNLRLIIELQRMSDAELAAMDRLQGSRQHRTILEVEIPQVTLPVVPGHNLAVLVEGAVRNHILLLKGYNAAQAFIDRQQQMILEDGE